MHTTTTVYAGAYNHHSICRCIQPQQYVQVHTTTTVCAGAYNHTHTHTHTLSNTHTQTLKHTHTLLGEGRRRGTERERESSFQHYFGENKCEAKRPHGNDAGLIQSKKRKMRVWRKSMSSVKSKGFDFCLLKFQTNVRDAEGHPPALWCGTAVYLF